MKSIILTGGGTAGHVTPNLALISRLQKEGYTINYIGSKDGMEKELITDIGVNYYGISSGKLRRYFDAKNFSDVFHVLKGISQATNIIRKLKPDIIFSKGGFVAVPVVVGGFLNRVPVIIHESDISPGLANKLAMPFAVTVCTTFPEALSHVKDNKGVLTGTPIREQLFTGNADKGRTFCGFDNNKPILLIMGGSQGSVKINTVLRQSLPQLLKQYQIIHLCGKNNIDNSLNNTKGYKQFEYISSELKDLFAAVDIIVSRAGSNSICEFLALKKPMLLIPLSKAASRGDQILNAASFQKQGFASVLEEEELSSETLINKIDELYTNRSQYISNMQKANVADGVDEVMKQIYKYTK